MRIDPSRIASTFAITCLLAGHAACARKSTSNTVDSAANLQIADTAGSVVVVTSSPDTARPRDQSAPTRPQPLSGDTARGIVRRYGAEPASRLALAPVDQSRGELLALSGTQMSELAAAEGVEVMVSGERTSERAFDVAPGGAIVFRVTRFVVRAVDGVPARDGLLVDVGGQHYLQTASGAREPIIGLPTALNTQMGARVFLVGPADRAPEAFGVLRKP